MPVDFGPEQWEQVRGSHRRWWDGELDRPLVAVEVLGRDPGRPCPETPLLSQATCTDLSWSAEQVIDRLDWELSRRVYLGDAFPQVNFNCFGPGVMAAFIGAELSNRTGRVWFHPTADIPITELRFEYAPDNVWLNRIKDLFRAGMERWQGQVLMGMPDLGGNLDILSTFLPGEKLLFDLYDHPDDVKRLTWEGHELWHRFYSELDEVLQPENPGYSDWSAVYSESPTYILQCDFCYMIGPDMCAEFVVPELAASCRRLAHTIYHLDGPGQLPHQDLILDIEELDAMQWVPGAGNPGCGEWPDVYRKISAAGKRILICNGGFAALDAVIDQVGTPQGVALQRTIFRADQMDETEARARLRSYGLA